MPEPPEEPRLTITLKRSAQPALSLPLYVRDLPGMLAPAPRGVGAGLEILQPDDDATTDDKGAPAELELDPLALRDLESLRSFLAKVANLGRPIRLWCWDARLQRLLTITGAAPDATTIEIDLIP